MRGIRPLERTVEGREDAEARIVQGYCAAVRSALTDDGRPPLEASGLKLHERLSAIAESASASGRKRGLPKALGVMRRLIGRGLEATASLWPEHPAGFCSGA